MRSMIGEQGPYLFGDLRREGVDVTGPRVIARCARAGHDGQTLDHEPTAFVLALRANDGERLTSVWQGAAFPFRLHVLLTAPAHLLCLLRCDWGRRLQRRLG